MTWAQYLVRDIVNRDREGTEYPGQIKVTVIREARAVKVTPSRKCRGAGPGAPDVKHGVYSNV